MAIKELAEWFVNNPYFITSYETIPNLLVCLVFMIWVHEAIHYQKAEKYGLKPHLGVDLKGFYIYTDLEPTPAQEKDIIVDSLLLSILPVLACFWLTGFWAFGLLLAYIYGIIPDLKILYENRQKKVNR